MKFWKKIVKPWKIELTIGNFEFRSPQSFTIRDPYSVDFDGPMPRINDEVSAVRHWDNAYLYGRVIKVVHSNEHRKTTIYAALLKE